MPLSLSQVEGRLIAMGLGQLLLELLSGPLAGPVTLPFGSAGQAASIQRFLYRWLYFNPLVKERISLRLDEAAAALTILPKLRPERRGRRGAKP